MTFVNLKLQVFLRTPVSYPASYMLHDTIWRGFILDLFKIDGPDSVRFHHDVIFCSDSIVVSSSGTRKLRVDFVQFWFQHISRYFLSSCIHGVLLFLSTINVRTRNNVYANSIFTSLVNKEDELCFLTQDFHINSCL